MNCNHCKQEASWRVDRRDGGVDFFCTDIVTGLVTLDQDAAWHGLEGFHFTLTPLQIRPLN